MIYGLYKFLRKWSRPPFVKFKVDNFLIIVSAVLALIILKKIQINSGLYILIPITVIYTGLLNKPYLYTVNNIGIIINKKILKRRYVFIINKKTVFLKVKRNILLFGLHILVILKG